MHSINKFSTLTITSKTSTLILIICLQGVRLSDSHKAPHPFLATDDDRPFWLQMMPTPFWLQMIPAPSGYR